MNQHCRARCDRRLNEAAHYAELAPQVAWNLFIYDLSEEYDGLTNSVLGFSVRKHYKHLPGLAGVSNYYARRFLLGDRLDRDADPETEEGFFPSLLAGHRASMKNNFARAVFSAVRSYCIPSQWQDMTLPALVQNGLEQFEAHCRVQQQSELPKS